jgi:phosphoribosyl-ATP pyrophosphohydrolase
MTLEKLAATIAARKGADPETSWTANLLAKGPEKCAGKFGEEAIEAIIEAVKGDRDRLAELDRREGTSGIAEKDARG